MEDRNVTQRQDHLENKRKQLSFRAWHRGTRETDLILGRFADAHIGGFDEHKLNEFARLLELPDPDIFNWVSGFAEIPDDLGLPVLQEVIAFHRVSGD